MRTQKKKFRIIVRPWTPRKIPYQIPMTRIKELMQEAYPKLKKVVYVGWVRRVVDGKKQIIYLAATGDSGIEARKVFKTSENFGEDIWLIE
jgi:hypothetical protein